MKHRQVWKLLQTLSIHEKVLFNSWLEGVLHGTQPEVLKMCEGLLIQSHAAFVWNHIYPGKPFRDSRLRYIANQLSEKICEFIAWQSFQQDRYRKDLYLIRGLNRRGSVDLFIKKWNQIKRKMDTVPHRDATYFRIYEELDKERYHFTIKHPDKQKELELPQTPNLFEAYWMQEMMHKGLLGISHASKDEELMKKDWFYQIIGIIQNAIDDKSPGVTQILSKLYTLMAYREGDINEIKSLVRTYKEQFGNKEMMVNIIIFLMNHLIRRVNQLGKTEDLTALLDVYIWGIEDELIFVDGFLTRKHFNALITLGVRLKRYKEVAGYLKDFQKYLPSSQRKEAHSFNLAYFHLVQKQYPEALRIFSRSFNHGIYEIRARLYVLQIQYELGEREDIEATLRNLKRFVQSQKTITPILKKGFGNCIDIFRKLIRVFLPKHREELAELLKNTRPLYSKEWLIEQFEKGG